MNMPNSGQGFVPSNASTEEILKRLEQQKFALDESAIVAQTDFLGRIDYVNDYFCRISEYSREELLGKNHRIINSGHHPKSFFEQMWATIRIGHVWKGEICNRAKSGRLYWVKTTIVPLLGAEGRPTHFLSIRQDITSLKEAQKLIVEQQSQMIAASKLSAIGEMAAAITHEINNPLGVILGRCEMLKSLIDQGNLDPQNLKRLVDSIEVTGHRIEKIVRSMKTLAHQSDEEPMQPTPVAGLLSDLRDLVAERFRNHGVLLTIAEVSPSLMVTCRAHEMLQVLVNLANNAFDALAELPEKWVKVEVRMEESPKSLIISVTDSGKGIHEENLAKLFMPFFSTKKVQYGTGLGLSISKNLMIRHKGDLIYDRHCPNTRFEMRLPL